MAEKVTEVQGIDLSRFEALVQSQEEGIDVELLDENGKAIGLKIGIVGPDSDRSQRAVREVAAEFAKAAAERESLEPATDDSDARMVAILAKISTHWAPNPVIGGKVVEFSEENAKAFYAKFRLFRDQIEAKAVRRAPFAKS